MGMRYRSRYDTLLPDGGNTLVLLHQSWRQDDIPLPDGVNTFVLLHRSWRQDNKLLPFGSKVIIKDFEIFSLDYIGL
jgi:hypothetical protein